MTRRRQGLFPPNPFFKGKALGTRLGLIETKGSFEKGGGGGLFHFEKTMVSVLHKDLEYKGDTLKYKKVGALEVMHPGIRIKFELSVSKPSRISPHEVK